MYWLLRSLADKKLKQKNEGSEDLLNKRHLRLPRISCVLGISEAAEEP